MNFGSEETHRSKLTLHARGNKVHQDLKSLYGWDKWKGKSKDVSRAISKSSYNFKNEIPLRGEGCEDPKIFLFLSYFSGLFK